MFGEEEKKDFTVYYPLQITHAFVFEWFVTLAAQQKPFQSLALHLAHVTLPEVAPHGGHANQLASQVLLSPLTLIPF